MGPHHCRFIIVMELALCGSLLDVMTEKSILNEKEARFFFRQLISAIDFCHNKFIAHRDLKLENLLIFWKNILKIGDFGFARYFDVEDPSTTFSLTFCGSNAYLPPEILHARPYNPYFLFHLFFIKLLYSYIFFIITICFNLTSNNGVPLVLCSFFFAT